MAALYVLFAALVMVVARFGRRSPRSRRSIDRYLKAMETLGEISDNVRRSETREPEGSSRTASPSAPTSSDDRVQVAFSLVPRRPTPHDFRSRRWFRFVMAGAFVALAAIVVGVALSSSGPTNSRHAAAERTRRGQSTRPSSRKTRTSRTTSPTKPNTTTTTRPASSTHGPVLSSLEPDTGAAGETVILSGTAFTSANGTIVATFDSRPAPTRCPSEGRCLVTVPAGLKGSVEVRLQTESGSSNPLVFHYG